MLRAGAALLATVLASTPIPPATGHEGAGDRPAAARLLVALEPGASLPTGARAVSRRLGIWAVAGDARMAARLRRARGVVAVEPVRRLRAASEQRSCAPRPDSPDGYLIPSIRAGAFPPPDPAPPVAVLDSGLDGSLPEFAGKVRSPVNVVSGGEDVTDADGHGTRVAGIAVARAGGVRGVSPASAVIPVKMLNSRGEATTETFVKAVEAAVDRGAKVVNASLTAPGAETSAEDDRMSEIAIGAAFSRGALVVAPTGNEGTEEPSVPSAYPHVLSVGASDESNSVATFSNTGDSVDLVAPGSFVTTTAPMASCGAGYGTGTGTSFAAPAVSGAAAVLEAARSDLSPSQRFELLRRSARDIGPPGHDSASGFGLLDVAAALEAPAPAGDGAEVDDDVYWVNGPNRSKNRPRLVRRRSETVRARVSAFNDPVDVLPVRLKRGEVVTATLRGAAGSRFALGLWNRNTRGFDISDRRTSRLIDYMDRSGSGERLKFKAARAGTYFLSVEAPHPDARETTYTLKLKRGRR